MYTTEAIAFVIICMHVFARRRGGSDGVVAGGGLRSAVDWRWTDGRLDGWKYHVAACDELRRELSRARGVAASATSVSIRPTRARAASPSPSALAGPVTRKWPERRRARQQEIGKYEKASRT